MYARDLGVEMLNTVQYTIYLYTMYTAYIYTEHTCII